MSTIEPLHTTEPVTRALVEDIKPTPIKERPPLGVVELTLAPDQSIKAVGVVYGLEHAIKGEGFEATFFLDQYNQRLRVLDYTAEDVEPLVQQAHFLAEANGFDKIIVMANKDDFQRFLPFGYVLEAVIRHYQRGDDAFVVSKFRSQERLTSPGLMDEIHLIEKIMADRRPARPAPLPAGHEVRLARREDIPELIELYQAIFETYPSPLMHPSYLDLIFAKESVFCVCTHGGDIVAAASAELHPRARAAELTDCATKPEARGRGLMTHILRRLEDELARRNTICAYTMARAKSYGMNNVFYRMGYEFMGRLINNCDIYGAFEDMNIWVRRLEAGARPNGGSAS